jgi:hypothetical protein
MQCWPGSLTAGMAAGGGPAAPAWPHPSVTCGPCCSPDVCACAQEDDLLRVLPAGDDLQHLHRLLVVDGLCAAGARVPSKTRLCVERASSRPALPEWLGILFTHGCSTVSRLVNSLVAWMQPALKSCGKSCWHDEGERQGCFERASMWPQGCFATALLACRPWQQLQGPCRAWHRRECA